MDRLITADEYISISFFFFFDCGLIFSLGLLLIARADILIIYETIFILFFNFIEKYYIQIIL